MTGGKKKGGLSPKKMELCQRRMTLMPATCQQKPQVSISLVSSQVWKAHSWVQVCSAKSLPPFCVQKWCEHTPVMYIIAGPSYSLVTENLKFSGDQQPFVLLSSWWWVLKTWFLVIGDWEICFFHGTLLTNMKFLSKSTSIPNDMWLGAWTLGDWQNIPYWCRV